MFEWVVHGILLIQGVLDETEMRPTHCQNFCKPDKRY